MPEDRRHRGGMPLQPAIRITTYVPADHRAAVVAGIHAVIGPRPDRRYDLVAWWSDAWTEQFRPLAGAKPTTGAIGEIAQVPTVRVDVVIPADEPLVERIIAEGIRPHHPWEVPVIIVDAVRVEAGVL
jgi:hypothetical protein